MQKENEKIVARKFMEKLKNKKFTMSTYPHNGESYTAIIQMRNSLAVKEFTKTDLFQYIMNLN